MFAGDQDIARAILELEAFLPEPLRALARVAYNYRWSWTTDGPAMFEAIDPERWVRCGRNPRRLLSEAPPPMLTHAAADAGFVGWVNRVAAELVLDAARPCCDGGVEPAHPVAFCCSEFAVHGSLPIYSGGLGVLAGDILKEASDLALPMVGIGLMYRTGYFHQRIDVTGYQHEYWLDADPDRLPCVKVTGEDGRPVTVLVPVDDENVTVQVWRVDVGRVPLYLLDTDLAVNSQRGRWITSRLYESNRAIRLAQYAVLGVGGVRALRALGIEPSVYHFNEGHPALGVFELLAQAQARAVPDNPSDTVWEQVREQVVFTTHTPVPAGNETYQRAEVLAMLGRIADLVGERERFLALGRIDPNNPNQPMGMSALALRASRHANAVSQRHGQVARAMWQPLFPGRSVQEVPITHITNGVHIPSWLRGPMRALLERYLGEDWLRRADQSATWAPVQDIPGAELWAARCTARTQLVEMIARRATSDRLRRGDRLDYAEAAGTGFDPERLTIGFARRLATYKRLHLVALLPERALGLIGGAQPVQFVFAGKAHPDDIAAKEVVRQVFALKSEPSVAGRAAFLEDYDMALAAQLVAGCDVWVNLPRPPNEASGTSGMKSCLGGGLQLSVLDGWWAEAFDGSNGWAINGDVMEDTQAQDQRDARALFDLLEQQVVPMFHERDAQGVPQRWVTMMRRSLLTCGPRFSASRMVREYADQVYRRD
ncbi:MAG: alpha-glucan family phosphorylase [Gammaproteobacteria bacterium]|uniref:alpha-glucan family phosphorylase n=1 Tax=Rhodoferax sp. TaxID=50421 RepID=UPI00180B75F7|nr:alpha-glucan family phosphorylase [Rhodoferax sp.]MBU3899446.1 alpha-glucan family phosphorylase [Gammaproteobacteria bacterium]MBA3057254.1 glycosyltransferase family 1 protein [Rhodoferax sp.]MBU3996350.1 alpha-glucan family phosphorylase [Gammaproteobacteria bacterium]MBU4080701.1 alpha-glucan family phosphorylase [Gammaproteobacteria bacterium]MBU4113509.1 alpha-glucan family phosphorylase [Gammaproteobacteria bacterium]